MNGIECVVCQVTLSAPTLTANQTHRFQFGEQIFRVTIDVEHPIDGLSGRCLVCQHQPAILRSLGKIVGHTHRTDTGLQSRFVDHRFNQVSVNVDGRLITTETFLVLRRTHDLATGFHQHVLLL